MELLNDIHAWLSALPPGAVYAALFGVAFLEYLFPPVPGDVAIVVAGMIAAAGAVSLPAMVVAAAAAGGLGFMTVYAVGRRLDDVIEDPARFRWLPKDDIRKAEAFVARFGMLAIAVNRFLPGIRSVIALSVGMSHLPPARVAAVATAAATVWAALLGYLGYALVDNRETLARLLGGFERAGVVLGGLCAAGLAVWALRVVRRRRRARGEG